MEIIRYPCGCGIAWSRKLGIQENAEEHHVPFFQKITMYDMACWLLCSLHLKIFLKKKTLFKNGKFILGKLGR